jgi:tetratricopeptide (TPR) repeat protein
MSDPRRLVRYMEGERATHRNAAVLRMDSLYYRALRMDPFLRRQFDRELIRLYIVTALTGDGTDYANRPLASFYTEEIMRDLPPMIRGRVMAGEGRLVQALDAFDDALRHSGRRRSVPARVIRHERGRMFALAGNDSMALVELGHARDAALEADEGDELVVVYESKALLDHGMGMLHERGGRRDAARAAYAGALMEDLSYFPAHQRLGALALVEGDTATAVQELALAAAAGREEPTVRLAYGALLARTRQFAQAEAELLAVTELAPYYAEPWFLLGLVRDWSGEGDAAAAYRAFLARARRDDPRRPQVEQIVAPAAAP